MDKRKIGIITFHRANNYGAVLQNMALIEALNQIDSNNKILTLDYRCDFLESPYKKNPFDIKTKNIIKNIFYFVRRILCSRRYKRLIFEFDEFRKKYLYLTESYDKESLLSNEPIFDIFITGSDQVWNDKITGADEIYSLGFAKKAKKASYAASAGYIEYIGNVTLKNIETLNCISVREDDLQFYLEDKLGKNIELVVDPVFLLSKKQWNKKLKKERITREKYILTYSVSEKTSDIVKIAKNISAKNGWNILHLDLSIKYGVRGKSMYGASPLEFIQLIRDAEIVIASSFHAVAFSIIFNKKFIVVPTKKTSSRIDSLLKMAKLEKCKVNSYDEFMKSKYENQLIETSALEQQIEISMNYLKKLLSF